MRKVGKNDVQPHRPQIATWCMRITCRIPKAADTHSEYAILIAFPLQQWLHEGTSELSNKHITRAVWIYQR